MNPVFKKLLENPTSMRPFIHWYDKQYPNTIVMFQNLPFSMQLGVYVEYFESIYNLYIISSVKGYSIHFTDNRKTPLNHELNYAHYRFNHNEPKSVMYGYELAILWLFENFDLPF